MTTDHVRSRIDVHCREITKKKRGMFFNVWIRFLISEFIAIYDTGISYDKYTLDNMQ